MAGPRYGLEFSQEGIPIQRAADYQKVLDDRWPFLDIAFEQEIPIEYEIKANATSYAWSLLIYEHNLGFLPGFTYRLLEGSFFDSFGSRAVWVVSTAKGIYLRGEYFGGDPASKLVMRLFIRCFAVDMLTPFKSPVEHGVPRVRTKSRKYGVKFLKPRLNPERFEGDEMSDFSIHNDAKALAVQQIGQLDLNPWARYDQINVTAIDTTADTLTIALQNANDSMGWVTQAGQAVQYFPQDFITYPNPLNNSSTYYVIPVGTNTIKLANSYQNALQGVAINLLSAGALPGTLSAADNSAAPGNLFYHDVGYPPTYMLAEYSLADDRATDTLKYLEGQNVINSLSDGFDVGYTQSTTETLAFTGAQAVATGRYAIMVLKDPIEVVG